MMMIMAVVLAVPAASAVLSLAISWRQRHPQAAPARFVD